MPDSLQEQMLQDEKLKQVVETGGPADTDDESMGKEMRDYYSGSKSRFQFMCMRCGNSITTQHQYGYGENFVKSNVRTEVDWAKRDLAYRIFSRIPIIGYFISQRYERRLDNKEDKQSDQRINRARLEAFEEVHGRFHKCSECGFWACDQCYQESDGLCGMCRQMKQTQQQVQQAQQDAQNQVNSNNP